MRCERVGVTLYKETRFEKARSHGSFFMEDKVGDKELADMPHSICWLEEHNIVVLFVMPDDCERTRIDKPWLRSEGRHYCGRMAVVITFNGGCPLTETLTKNLQCRKMA